MEFNIEVLKGASEVVDSIANVLGRFGASLARATGKGLQIAAFRRLVTLSAQITMLTESQEATFLPVLQDYANSASPANWEHVKSGIAHTLVVCKTLLDQIKASQDDIVTKPFFGDLISLLLQRDEALKRIQKMDAPTATEALSLFRQHVDKYQALLGQLRTTNTQLKTYIDTMQTGRQILLN